VYNIVFRLTNHTQDHHSIHRCIKLIYNASFDLKEANLFKLYSLEETILIVHRKLYETQ